MPVHELLAAMAALGQRLGHAFTTSAHLQQALTHPSWRNEQANGGVDNQRLEFLGDAVLGLVVSQALVERLPDLREGELTVLKSQLVRESSLAALAEQLNVGAALRLGRGEEGTGGRQRPSVLADAMEAIIGAVFVDAGYDAAQGVVLRLFAESIEAAVARVRDVEGHALSASTANWKTALQELLQQHGCPPPVYTLVGEEGPVHERRFRVEAAARCGGDTWTAVGGGSSKKSAESDAAEKLYCLVAAKLAPM
jgi:ribonuclease-3